MCHKIILQVIYYPVYLANSVKQNKEKTTAECTALFLLIQIERMGPKTTKCMS